MKYIVLLLLFCISSMFGQENSLKDQKISEELSNTTPELSQEGPTQLIKTPPPLNIDGSSEVLKQEKELPNEGLPYFTLSGGLAPYQISLGVLKYFIPEWWGHLELNLTFFPNVDTPNYYLPTQAYEPFVAFKIITGYSFYTYNNFEMSVFAQMQFAFINTAEIPFVFSLGFRFIYSFFWIDLGASYAVSSTGIDSKLFYGFHPTVSLGVRF